LSTFRAYKYEMKYSEISVHIFGFLVLCPALNTPRVYYVWSVVNETHSRTFWGQEKRMGKTCWI